MNERWIFYIYKHIKALLSLEFFFLLGFHLQTKNKLETLVAARLQVQNATIFIGFVCWNFCVLNKAL